MSQILYYVELDDERFGPFALETLINMHLLPDVLVLSTGANVWRRADEYPELLGSLNLSLYNNTEEDEGEHTEFGNNVHTPPVFNKDSVFYIRRGDGAYGPYSLTSLSSLALSETSVISLDGKESWHRLSDIPGLLLALEAIASQDADAVSKKNQSGDAEPIDDENFDKSSGEKINALLIDLKSMVTSKQQKFRRVFDHVEAEREFYISEYQSKFDTLMNLLNKISQYCEGATIPKRAVAIIKATVAGVIQQVNQNLLKEFKRLDERSSGFAHSSVRIGRTRFSLPWPLDGVEILRMDFLNVLGGKNLFVSYDESGENDAVDFVNNLIGRLYKSNPVRSIVTEVVDADYLNGLSGVFKLFNRDLYNVTSRPDEVRGLLSSLQNRAANVFRNLLIEPGTTLRGYNLVHENNETTYILVLQNFPKGLSLEDLANIQRLAKVGPKAGIYIVILADIEHLGQMTDREREAFDIDAFMENSNVFSFKRAECNLLSVLDDFETEDSFEGSTEFENLSVADLKQIVNDVNSKCELKEDVVVAFSDYIPDTKDWWRGNSAKQITVPFGIGNDMQEKFLKITQESGQNTAVVIGEPGSGKSVFLHTLICNAAIKYSPDELRMYLIDFSGVEFNAYAQGKLPHARVIAPEAEREFGLSILNELIEEGSRRMNLCREHNVGNIFDLKRVAPEMKVPRLLVIIDEFQKFFEVDNDTISKEANSKIHIIIQEFRKFGINLILATQKLPTSSFLPRDLIANRVVFKSAPNDFESLISTESHRGMPRLRCGQCVYNCESGAAYANETVQGFFCRREDIDPLLAKIDKFGENFPYEHEPLKVFSSGDLPEFEQRRLAPNHEAQAAIPYVVPIYFGESIAVSDVDVNIELVKENANNILILGGKADVARNIAFNAMRSTVEAHEEKSAEVIVLNGMRPDNPLQNKLSEFSENTACEFSMASSTSDIENILKEVVEEIERRRNDESVPQQHIYITCFDFQAIRAFDKDTSGMMPKLSVAAKNMEAIIRTGSSVGVFVILETDMLDALSSVAQSSPLAMFNFRVALQMPEDMSYKVIGNAMANKLFVFNRPSSVFRGYVRDNAQNQTIKFKPYK